MSVEEVLKERGNRYGEFKGHAKTSQSLKDIVKFADGWSRLTCDKRECLSMIMHKVARILNGDPEYIDSWVDIAGYAQLIVNQIESDKNWNIFEEKKMRGDILSRKKDAFIYLAELCKESYSRHTFKTLSDTVLVADKGMYRIYAITGSDDTVDWISNLLPFWYAFGIGRVHGGFWRSAKRIVKDIKDRQVSHIVITGHSRGAGIAPFVAYLMRKKYGCQVQVVGFSSPRHGSVSASNKVADKIFGNPVYVNSGGDPVTKVPPSMVHFGEVIKVGDDELDLSDHSLENIINEIKKSSQFI